MQQNTGAYIKSGYPLLYSYTPYRWCNKTKHRRRLEKKKAGSLTVPADVEAEHPRGVEVAEGSAQRREPTVSQVVAGRLHRVQRRAGLEEVRQLESGCRDRDGTPSRAELGLGVRVGG